MRYIVSVSGTSSQQKFLYRFNIEWHCRKVSCVYRASNKKRASHTVQETLVHRCGWWWRREYRKYFGPGSSEILIFLVSYGTLIKAAEITFSSLISSITGHLLNYMYIPIRILIFGGLFWAVIVSFLVVGQRTLFASFSYIIMWHTAGFWEPCSGSCFCAFPWEEWEEPPPTTDGIYSKSLPIPLNLIDYLVELKLLQSFRPVS